MQWVRFLTCLIASAGVAVGAAVAEPLSLLARPGPWAGINALVSYGERLWFANSVPFENHNAADIYSYDPRTGTVRYEANLLS
jgi:hypothetical protein